MPSHSISILDGICSFHYNFGRNEHISLVFWTEWTYSVSILNEKVIKWQIWDKLKVELFSWDLRQIKVAWLIHDKVQSLVTSDEIYPAHKLFQN